jgi:fructose-1,6-bisphosphatase/inositol monophosphatase family enzyme
MAKSFEEDVADAAAIAPEVVQDVMAYIRKQRFTFAREDKIGLDGSADIVTDIDKEAQRRYHATLSLLTPLFGMIGEEDGLAKKCRYKGHDVYWTNDPIDGTEAFARKQSHGIGTMLALVADGTVAAACIGDICTGERYAYGPAHAGAQRVDPSGSHTELGHHPEKTLQQQLVLIGQRPDSYSPAVQRMVGLPAKGGMFRDMEIDRGSIGIRMARLWKGEVGALIMKGHYETPWDNTPLIGFCKKLGFTFLRQDGTRRFVEYEPRLLKSPKKVNYDTLVIHGSRIEDLRKWEYALRG